MTLSEYVQRHIHKIVADPFETYTRRIQGPFLAEVKVDGMTTFLFDSPEYPEIYMATKHNGLYTQANFPNIVSEYMANKVGHDNMLYNELVRKTETMWIHDALMVNGEDVTTKTLMQRKQLLRQLWPTDTEHVKLMDRALPTLITEPGAISQLEQINNFYQMVLRMGHEGIMLKPLYATYNEKPWCKKKEFNTYDAFVTGATVKAGRDEASWDLAVYDAVDAFDANRKAVNVGSVYSTIKEVDRLQIQVGTVLEISAQQIWHTGDTYRFRHPVVVKVRTDKTPYECLLSQLQ